MARTKKNKSKTKVRILVKKNALGRVTRTKTKVRKWRDKPMDKIIQPAPTKNEYIVIMPGCQMQIDSDLNFEDFVESIQSQIVSGLVVLHPTDDNYFSMQVAKDQHFPLTVMTLNRFTRLQSEYRFAQERPGQQGRH